MPRISEMSDSKYLKKEDVGDGVLVTCGEVSKTDVALETAPHPEYRWCLSFEEAKYKPLILNKTNMQRIELCTGSDDTDEWRGHKIVLYNDEEIMYEGKITGGIRVDVRRTKAYYAKQAAKSAPKPTREPGEDADDGIPF